MEDRLDVLFGSETRPRPLRVVGPGLKFYDGDTLLFQAGGGPLLRTCLRVMADGKGDSLAARLLASFARL